MGQQASPAWRKRWRLDRERGITRLVATAPVEAHVRDLSARGATARGIARAAGVSPQTVVRLLSGNHAKMQRTVAARILAVRLADVLARGETGDRHGFVPAEGSRRRIRALLAAGWTHQHITAAMQQAATGLQRSAIVLHQRGELVEARTAKAVAAAYDALAMRPGPSAATRGRAARAGYPPALAWDDDTIDDPTAQPADWRPQTGKRSTASMVEDAAELAAAGERLEVAAARLGVAAGTLERALYRAGRRDLIERMSRRDGAA